MAPSLLPTKVLTLAFASSRLAHASNDLPASFGPPLGSDPLTWGFYATHEIQMPTCLSVTGSIPKWVTGSLYRGAAATWDVGNYTAEHWFDGFSRNHLFQIADGSVTYRSRNASDELMHFVQETGLFPGNTFGSDPCKTIFGAFETTYRDGTNEHGNKTTANTAIAFIPNFPGLARNTSSVGGPLNTLVSTTDANRLQQFDPVTLEAIELFTYQASNPLLSDSGHTCAHPAMTEDGTIYNYLLDTSTTPPVYRVFGVMSPGGETKIIANITDAPPAYIHSMFRSEQHVILIIWQADFTKAGKTLLSSMGPWNPERKTLFYVIDPVKGGVVSKYESEDAFFAFHQINSFEDASGNIYIDLPTMKDYSFLDAAMVENLRANLGSKTHPSSKNDLAGSFTRYKLPFYENNKASNGSFITHTATGKPYRYAYGIHVEKIGYFADSIIKVDTETQSWKIWSPETKQLPSEPIFVPRPGATAEDDGVVLTVAMDSAEKKSSLVVIDATTMKEISRAHMPIVMGYGFHGAYRADS
ncbi:carotenoid oxygenase [Trichoderma velutinum]